MNTLFRRWRILNAAEQVLRVLRILAVVRAALPIVHTAVKFRKEKGR